MDTDHRHTASRVGEIQMSEFRVAETVIKPGLSVIEASAGTGKTYTVTHLVPRLLLEGTVEKLEQVLLVTYTNDAAGELAERVRMVLEKLHAPPATDEEEKDADLHAIRLAHGDKIPDVIGRALLDIDRLNVSTIHSFCLRVLQEEGVLCGLPVMPELMPDIRDSVERAVRDLWEEKVAGDERLACHALAGDWKIGDDLKLALMAAGQDEYAFVPEPRDLDQLLQQIDECRARLGPADLEALREFMGRVPEEIWNTSARDPDERESHLGGFADKNSAANWLKSARWMASLGLTSKGHIKGNSKAGKQLSAEAALLEAVKSASEATALAAEVGWAWQTRCAREATRRVRARMETDRLITYDGLISRVRDALVHSPGRLELAQRLRDRYKVALVDESQDTDPRQFDIFSTVFLGAPGAPAPDTHRLVLVGDPKQAIYAFRGADLNTYLKAREGAPPDQVFTLSRTFRAPPALVKAANAFFTREGAFLNADIRMQPATAGRPEHDAFLDEGAGLGAPRVELWLVDDFEARDYDKSGKRLKNTAVSVAAKIASLLENKAEIVEVKDGERTARTVGPGDFAVLVDKHHQAEALRVALADAGVPSITAGGADIMGTEEASDLVTILRALAQPRNRKRRFAALATRLLGRSASHLRDIAATEDALLGTFARWGKILTEDGVAAALSVIDAEEKVSSRLSSMPGGERRLSNFRQLTDLLQSALEERGNHAGRMVRWAAQETEDARGKERPGAEERQQQLESDARAVKIATMHSAKGLEFSLVFCPFLWGSGKVKNETLRLFMPAAGVSQLVCLKKCDAATKAVMDQARFEERLRLAYVAMTRARVKLWVHAGAVAEEGAKNSSALDWLLRRDGEATLEDLTTDDPSAGRGQRQQAGLATLIEEGDAADVLADCGAPSLQTAVWTGDAEGDAPLADALPLPEIPAVWSMTSFSALTREKNPKGGETAPTAGEAAETTESDAAANSFLDAPAGALVGTAIHDWMEAWDFSAPDLTDVQSHLDRYALSKPKEKPAWPERVASMLEALRAAALPGFDCMVAVACPDAAASEWHFQLPLDAAISPQKLAGIFARHGQEEYAALLETLPQAELLGYLHGFIDRIAVHPETGRWGVIDWKTNKLGDSVRAHREPSSLLRCAMNNHYLLQMHLYLVALRRYLGETQAPDDAWLVFLRGVHAGSTDGILHIKPPEELLAELGGLFRSIRS